MELIDANVLKQNNLQKRQIADYMNEIVLKINSEIKAARRDGNHTIITEIPIVFDIPNMENKDAQRIVYSNTISMLKRKNFNTQINITPDACRVKISWLSAEEDALVKQQLKLINDNTGKF